MPGVAYRVAVLAFVVRLYLALALLSAPVWGVEIVVEALLPGIAVMKVDGARITLREGETEKGLRLIAADAQSALVEISGQEQRLRVSQRISSQFSEPTRRSITIPRNEQMQYRTTAEINGVRLPVIVDTGANIVALNTRDARAVGIKANEGIAASVETAGAVVAARRVVLDSVDVGGIRIEAVAATVIAGAQPSVVLLGMSYLQHVELEDRAGVLTLRGRW
jgi:aspartyl protease family protein